MQITNNVAANNAENKLNYLQTADSWMQKVQDMLGRMGEIAVMAKSVVRVGDIGTGGVAKLVNNMIVGAAFSIIAEGFALAMKNGIDPQVLYDAIKDGWAGSTVLNVAAPGIINQDYKPGGTIDLLFKDIGYALSLARSQNVPVPVTAIVDEVFKTARASGRGPFAQQIITQMWENLLHIDR